MNRQERIKVVGEQISDFTNRLLKEYDMTLTEMIGIFELIKLNWMYEAMESDDDGKEFDS